ncbi:MAG: 50S ribosomal protein L11 methyltransferase [Bacteroidales bacterium]|nr:50S ribosomal protein L11 methyltransferase [Bacteroidales bacterium]
MVYLELHLKISPFNTLVNDVLAAKLGEMGFESFVECEDGMLAYVPSKVFNEKNVNNLLPKKLFGSEIILSNKMVPDKDWNHEWEKNYFQPIVIGKDCVIHSSFHTDVPKATYDILIDPKMAFGTGHHETTSLMIGELLQLDVKEKSFLDMGCGTAVLSILASFKGADPILGIDIDKWAVQNALENIKLNKTPEIEIQFGGAELLEKAADFDIIFANINRNILLNDMASYAAKMHVNSLLYMSGFYETDIPLIQEKAESLGLTYQGFVTKNNWVAVHFVKG